MADLKHWVFATEFTAREAAYLVLGVDPSARTADSPDVRHIEQRMSAAYTGALDAINYEVFLEPTFPDDWDSEIVRSNFIPRREQLRSVQMERLLGFHEHGIRLIEGWLEGGRNRIDEQLFSRPELGRWIIENNLVSNYSFDPETAERPLGETQSKQEQDMETRWPWGSHETDALRHLAAAAARFWVRYDPLDATTAPTNKDVSTWLQEERKVSEVMANSIASMLRPDGLRTGPRK